MSLSQTMTKTLEIELALPIQTYDIDFAGIVSNIVYIRWLEDLRLKILETYLPLDKLLRQGYCPIITSTQIEYKQSLRLGDRPIARMWMSKLSRVRCTLQAEIYLEERLVVTATQTGFFKDLNTMRPLAVPEPLRNAYTGN
ncbi:thioesterase family protein [Myxosarcina sp. GI1]|uniref:acyl-CoA thioesterase n=1 Tax=Myxosarcina sp. GI1 TaxID=1541065 RepID=UPI00055ACC78|nr:thioesterase family protein [Myxosarcina sp. GI1]